MMTFAVGEKVVYPNQGVGTIENISTRYFETRPEKFYLLRLVCSSMTVMVPFSHVEDLRLRKVTRNAEIARVVAFLSVVLGIGFVVSFIVAYGAVAWFLGWVRKHGFAPFAVYRIILGSAVLYWASRLGG